MARKNPVPQREKDIGRRLRRFRHLIVINRVELANELEIGVPRLASYESGQVPIPYGVIKKMDFRFGLNFHWLATGHGDPRESLPVPDDFFPKTSDKTAFSRVYDNLIAPWFEAWNSQQQSPLQKAAAGLKDLKTEVLPTIGVDRKATLQAVAAKLFKATLDNLPAHLHWKYYRKLMAASGEFLSAHVSESGESSVILSEIDLTGKVSSLTKVSVQAVLPKLIHRLKRATEARGKKSELADWLGVHRQMVTDWLSGKQEPGGENTLRLLHWVELQERQK